MNNMAKILITGSADKNGIGQAGAKLLIDQGHKVYLHARNQERAKDATEAVPKAEGVVVGDISTIAGAKATAAEANKFGPFDTVVHNAALGPSAVPSAASTVPRVSFSSALRKGRHCPFGATP